MVIASPCATVSAALSSLPPAAAPRRRLVAALQQSPRRTASGRNAVLRVERNSLSRSRPNRQCRAACIVRAELPQLVANLPPLGQDIAAAAFAAVGALVVIKGGEMLASRNILDRKLTRKLVHIMSGPLFVAAWTLYSPSPEARYIAALVPALNGVRLLAIGTGAVQNEGAVRSISREGDANELLRGPLYYVIVLVGITLFYWRSSPVGAAAVAAMCAGDGFADVVGRRFGSVKLPFNPDKSVAGSVAMFGATIAASAALIALFQGVGYLPASDWSHTLPALVAIAAGATVAEALPVSRYLDDNISVPVVALLLASALL